MVDIFIALISVVVLIDVVARGAATITVVVADVVVSASVVGDGVVVGVVVVGRTVCITSQLSPIKPKRQLQVYPPGRRFFQILQ